MSKIIKFKSGKKNFEILVDEKGLALFLEGKESIKDLLKIEKIFVNAKKGNIASEKDLLDVFLNKDIFYCADKIIKDGYSQTSSLERKHIAEQYKKSVINYIHKNYNSKNGLPYSLSQIENFIDESKLKLDPNIQIYKQAKQIVSELQNKTPFINSCLDYTIKIKKEYFNQTSHIIYKFSPFSHREKIEKDNVIIKMSLLKSDIEKFIFEINKTTGGDYSLKIGH